MFLNNRHNIITTVFSLNLSENGEIGIKNLGLIYGVPVNRFVQRYYLLVLKVLKYSLL